MSKKISLKVPKKQEGRLDKYANYLLLGKELTDSKKDYLEKMQFAFTSLLDNSRQMVVEMLIKQYDLSANQPYKIINDAISLFGDIDQANREGLRYMQGQRLMKLHELAMQKEEYELAMQILKEYNKINHLYQSPEDETNVQNFIESLNMTIIFSSSEKALQPEETEDIDYEEA